MRLIKSKNANENYLAKVVRINDFHKHSNPEVTRLKCVTIDGFNVITGIDSEPGYYIYFPTSSKINSDFLKYANLYRDKELNSDPTQTGMFESNGRVKAIKLKGELSEGFIIPFTIFQNYIISVTNFSFNVNANDGTEFDSVEHEGKEFWICKKYTPQIEYRFKNKTEKKLPKGLNRIRNDQFRLHYSTTILKKCPYVIKPDSIINISYKIHGTSGISAYVLCHKPLTWKEKIAKWLTGESFDKYDYIYSSRSVIKNKYYNPNVGKGYYSEDIWAEADRIVKPKLEKGQSVYYEIVGYLPNGKYIQKNYDYGCVPPKDGLFIHNVNFKVRVYRVTHTNVDGKVIEYTPIQVEEWCKKVGLQSVQTCYFGRAEDLYPEIELDDKWSENFINYLSNDKRFYMEMDSPHCINIVPHEGLVIKPLDCLGSAFKLKSFYFLSGEQKLLDKGETNIEDEA